MFHSALFPVKAADQMTLSQALKDKDGGPPIDEELFGPSAPPGYRDWDDGGF